MEIDDMSDWEIYGVLQKRGEARKQAEQNRRERVCSMIYDIMKSDDLWNEIIMAEARQSLRPSEYDGLNANPHEALKHMNIHISFSPVSSYG
jgi:hypothetical protein